MEGPWLRVYSPARVAEEITALLRDLLISQLKLKKNFFFLSTFFRGRRAWLDIYFGFVLFPK